LCLKGYDKIQVILQVGMGKLMSGEYRQFEQRKKDHIDLALMDENQANEHHEFDAVRLIHDALPDLNFDEISLISTRLGKRVEKPLMIASMTAGHQGAVDLNRCLMAACAEKNWAMGVGSQRRELTDRSESRVWALLRKDYPAVSLFSNLGIAQLVTTPMDAIERITDALQAEALIIHCNPLQECIQPEGTPLFKGCWQALERLVDTFSLPIIVKETGCGFSKETLIRLNNIGVAAVDVSGLGGTHWGRIEGHRAINEPMRQQASKTFRHWGIGTIHSVRQANALSPTYEIWGSGGVRHGLDAAKLLALGAHHVAFAKPILAAALHSKEHLMLAMDTIEYELKVAMFCTGSRTIDELKEKVSC
jgi:isopentenyl-diphosphate delta-isomerase